MVHFANTWNFCNLILFMFIYYKWSKKVAEQGVHGNFHSCRRLKIGNYHSMATETLGLATNKLYIPIIDLNFRILVFIAFLISNVNTCWTHCSKMWILYILLNIIFSVQWDDTSLHCYTCDHSESFSAKDSDKDYLCLRNFTNQNDHKRQCRVGEIFCNVRRSFVKSRIKFYFLTFLGCFSFK